MWPETSSSVQWDPPRGSSVLQAENPTLHSAHHEHRDISVEKSFCNHEKSSHKALNIPEGQVRSQTKIDETQPPILKTSAKEAIVMNKQTDSKEEEPDNIWMKFVFGGNDEDEDIDPSVGPPSPSLVPKHPRSDMPEYFLKRRKSHEDSPTFSTFVHNSNDSQNPLQPKYISSGRRNLMQRPHEHTRDMTSVPQTSNSTKFSLSVPQLNESQCSPILKMRHQDGGHNGRSYIDRDGESESHASKAHSKNFDLPHDTPSSKRDDISMIAIANSQGFPSTLDKSPLPNPKRKVVFEKQHTFVSNWSNQ